MTWLLVAGMGLLGVLCRYGLVVLLPASPLSWPVLLVNVLGSLLAGVIFAASTTAGTIMNPLIVAVLIGFLGGFTTFSSMALDTVRLLQSSEYFLAAVNILLNNFLSILACILGIKFSSLL